MVVVVVKCNDRGWSDVSESGVESSRSAVQRSQSYAVVVVVFPLVLRERRAVESELAAVDQESAKRNGGLLQGWASLIHLHTNQLITPPFPLF
jgi:hypothetical protein